MPDYHHALAVAIEAARQAGRLLREEFHRPGGPRGSGGHAPIDAEAEKLIRELLLAACPSWGYRGEETGTAAGTEPGLWLVDPNDGTSAYLKGWRGSAVSIATLHQGVPVLGVVHAFAHPDDEGDLIAWAEGCGPVQRNGRPVQADLASGRLDSKAIVFVSQGADRNSVANAACVQPARYIALPSIAYRLALTAAGEGVAAVSLSGAGDWDYAAGHALVRGVGGILIDERGEEVRYDAEGRSTTRWCFGGAPAAVRELQKRDWQQVFTPTPLPAPPFGLVGPVPGRRCADPGVLARAQGCLLGQLAGDSLGGLVEFQSEWLIRQRYPGGCRDLIDGGTWHLLAGQPTDDSELALMLARTLVQRGAYDPTAALEAYVHWFKDPETFDVGGTIGTALSAAAHAEDPAERLRLAVAAASRQSQANGALMRISPLGIFGAGRPEQDAALAREDCRLTHPHPVCQDACAIFVSGLARAIHGGGGPEACYAAARAEAVRPEVQPALARAVLAARHTPPADYTTQMGWVLIALHNAFYQLLHAPSLEEGLVDTVMRGGDTDTNGAIAGALLGAVHGRQGIPARWLRALLSCRPLPGSGTHHPRAAAFWPVDALELAEALLVAGQLALNSPGQTSAAGTESCR
jgi:ADP-ribosylglycohydrolase/fructose-1,6-bisphosphatase/inositol monophosphatase family enzyme